MKPRCRPSGALNSRLASLPGPNGLGYTPRPLRGQIRSTLRCSHPQYSVLREDRGEGLLERGLSDVILVRQAAIDGVETLCGRESVTCDGISSYYCAAESYNNPKFFFA